LVDPGEKLHGSNRTQEIIGCRRRQASTWEHNGGKARANIELTKI
jgi:hypothetical protein